MAFCTSCGSELPANTKFCTACGAGAGGGEEAAPGGEARPVPVTAAAPAASFPEPVPVPAPMSAAPAPVQTVPRPQPAPPQPPAYIPLADTEPTKGSRYAVISTAGYFGTMETGNLTARNPATISAPATPLNITLCGISGPMALMRMKASWRNIT